jgi:hypothetical protein
VAAAIVHEPSRAAEKENSWSRPTEIPEEPEFEAVPPAALIELGSARHLVDRKGGRGEGFNFNFDFAFDGKAPAPSLEDPGASSFRMPVTS